MRQSPLSVQLRDATASVHADAERSPFITRLMGGGASISDFAALTAQLHPVYAALERAMDIHGAHPAVAPLLDPLLIRTPRLAADLAVLVGDDWAEQQTTGRLRPLPATRAYVERLQAVSVPEALVAHHYVRLLGDLSGGQAIARLVARHYGVPGDALTFYRFDGIGKPKPYRDAYRAKLDALALDDTTRTVVVGEAVQAFKLNQAVFSDLERARDDDLAAVG